MALARLRHALARRCGVASKHLWRTQYANPWSDRSDHSATCGSSRRFEVPCASRHSSGDGKAAVMASADWMVSACAWASLSTTYPNGSHRGPCAAQATRIGRQFGRTRTMHASSGWRVWSQRSRSALAPRFPVGRVLNVLDPHGVPWRTKVRVAEPQAFRRRGIGCAGARRSTSSDQASALAPLCTNQALGVTSLSAIVWAGLSGVIWQAASRLIPAARLPYTGRSRYGWPGILRSGLDQPWLQSLGRIGGLRAAWCRREPVDIA